MDIRVRDDFDSKKYVSWGAIPTDGLILSASGKAAMISTDRGDKWVPVSILRRAPDTTGVHCDTLLIPQWWMMNNGVRW